MALQDNACIAPRAYEYPLTLRTGEAMFSRIFTACRLSPQGGSLLLHKSAGLLFSLVPSFTLEYLINIIPGAHFVKFCAFTGKPYRRQKPEQYSLCPVSNNKLRQRRIPFGSAPHNEYNRKEPAPGLLHAARISASLPWTNRQTSPVLSRFLRFHRQWRRL